MERCEHCGHEFQVGDYPFCPHGKGVSNIKPDDVPGGFIAENGFDTPQKFYSHSAHEKALAAEGLQIKAMNRGPNDKICKRWDMPTEQTLKNAAELLSRGAQAVRARRERWANASIPISVTEGDAFRIKQDR